VISALARQALAPNGRTARVQRNGISLLPSSKQSTAVTLELVNQLRDELP
jgi:hypothetical protein